MTEPRRRLKQLVDEAETLIQEKGQFFTEGNICALEAEIRHAREVLSGAYRLPFERNREFYQPRQEEEALFAMRRYTMTPSYHMTEYGLEPALEWFRTTHVMDRLPEAETAALARAEEILDADTSGAPGSLDPEAVEQVRAAKGRVKKAEGEARGIAVVQLFNAIRRARMKRVLRLQREPDSNLFLPGGAKEKLIHKVMGDSILSRELERICGFAERYSPEQIRMLPLDGTTMDYNMLNQNFALWSKSEQVYTFETPVQACYAKLTFLLPKEDNEEDGLGHVWLDEIRVAPAQGPDWPIQNGGFEVGEACPEHWTPVVFSGNPVLAVEKKAPFCGVGGRSVKLQNPTPYDMGGWQYDELISIEGGQTNTITFMGKLDGKLKRGVEIRIEFLNARQQPAGEYQAYFNRKSALAAGDFALSMQADAIVYYFTGRRAYAEKTKREILFVLHDFCQGIEHWLVTGQRPQGCDAYGAVQGGRILCSVMSAYTLIRDAEIFTPEEQKKMMALLTYFVPYLMDLRDRTELSDDQIQADAGNWQTDMAAGVGCLMMAMPDFPMARQWLDNANSLLRSQLSVNVGADGSWPESVRYHFAALSRFAVYAKILKNCTGEDWLAAETLCGMFRYPVMVQTPAYDFFDGKISTPNFGDHDLSGGEEFAPFGIYCADIAETDPALGALMYRTWVRAGRPAGKYWGEAIAFEHLLGAGETFGESGDGELVLTSTGDLRDAGIYLFRKGVGTGNESYFALNAPPRKIGHGHYDIGSFILYSHNIPLVIDPAIEGYFDSTKDWYVSSSAHSVVQFERSGGKKAAADPFDIHLEKTDYSALAGWDDTPRTAELAGFYTGAKEDSVAVRIQDPEGRGVHTRKVTYIRESELYVISDQVDGFDGNLRWSLCIAAQSAEILENRVTARGYYQMDLDVIFLGDPPELSLESGRCLKMFPCDGPPQALYLRAVGQRGFTVLLHPRRHGEPGLRLETSREADTVHLAGQTIRIDKRTGEITCRV